MLLVLLLSLFALSLARTGVDLSILVSTTSWKALFPSPAANKNFAIIHLGFYNNTINPDGLITIQNAWKAGIQDLSVFVYPCMPNSSYVKSNNATVLGCPPDAGQQIDKMINILAQHGIYFRNASWGMEPYALPNTTVVLQTLYVNLEDTVPNLYFSSKHSENMAFLSTIVNHAASKSVDIGIYTSLLDWQNIFMNKSPNGQWAYAAAASSSSITVNPFASKKLWTPRYDQLADMSFYSPFGNWSTVQVKQMTGGAKDARRIGNSRVCTDYVVD